MEKVADLYYFVGTDPVGLEDLMSVEKALLGRNPEGKAGRRNGYKAVWFSADPTDPVSLKLERKGITPSSRRPEDGDVPSGLILNVGRQGIPLLKRWSSYARRYGVRLLWLESFHGASVRPEVSSIPAGTICVYDDVAAQAVLRQRPKTPVTVCGKPSLRENRVFAEDREDVRMRVRKLLGVQDTERLGCVLLDAVSGTELDPFMRAMVHMRRVANVRWSVRLSPRLSPPTAQRYRNFLQRSGLCLTVFDQSYPLDLAHAADVAVADSEHELAYITAALGTPTVVYLPRARMPDPPHVSAGAVHLVRGSPANLPGAICAALTAAPAPGLVGLRDLLIPNAAKRVVRCLLAAEQEEKERAA